MIKTDPRQQDYRQVF